MLDSSVEVEVGDYRKYSSKKRLRITPTTIALRVTLEDNDYHCQYTPW
jgi:hypothetical protein